MQVLFWEIFAFLYQSATLENYLDESSRSYLVWNGYPDTLRIMVSVRTFVSPRRRKFSAGKKFVETFLLKIQKCHKLSHRDRRLALTLGRLRNHDDDSNKNVTNLHIWLWKTIVLHALHVQFSFLTFRRPSRSFCDVKWPVLQLRRRRDHMMTNVQFCLLISEALVSV